MQEYEEIPICGLWTSYAEKAFELGEKEEKIHNYRREIR